MQDAHTRFGPQATAALVAAIGWTSPTPPDAAFAAAVGGPEIAVQVYANHDRWVVQCPDCNSAQLACPNDQRFMCSESANISVGGLWRPVVWPADADAIAAALNERVERSTRSWEPFETVEDLQEQNGILAGGAVVDEHQAAQASPYEGHTHNWVTADRADGLRECTGCPLVLPPSAIDEGA